MPLDMTTYDGPAEDLLTAHPELRGKYVHAVVTVDEKLPPLSDAWTELGDTLARLAPKLPKTSPAFLMSRKHIHDDYR